MRQLLTSLALRGGGGYRDQGARADGA